MLLNPMGGVIFTSDGHAIVRDIFPDHPIPKLVIEGSRAQDEEIGDGTTSVVIYTCSLFEQLVPLVSMPGIHSAHLSKSLTYAKNYILGALK